MGRKLDRIFLNCTNVCHDFFKLIEKYFLPSHKICETLEISIKYLKELVSLKNRVKKSLFG